jgi:cell division protein FtsB
MATGTGGQGSAPRRPARRGASARPGAKATAARPGAKATAGRPGAKAAASRAAAKAGPLRQAAAARAARDGRGVRSLRRILVLASIVVLLAITLVPTLRSYLHQQGEIEAMRERVASQRLTVEELQKEQARWSDNAYVEQQARERLKFVKVGDRSYTVIDGDPAVRQPAPGVAAAPKSTQDHPWYGQLWESAKVADSGPAAAVRAPVQAPEK